MSWIMCPSRVSSGVGIYIILFCMIGKQLLYFYVLFNLLDYIYLNYFFYPNWKKTNISEGVWDRICDCGGVRDRDWAWHQMKHERGGGEAGSQYILINSQSSLCKSWKIQSRLENGSSRPTPAAAIFSLLCHYWHTAMHKHNPALLSHTTHPIHFTYLTGPNSISVHLGFLGES